VTNHYDFKYWEVGNECYGSYETDNHASPHDPYTYATNFAAYAQQMRAADPTIKIGVVLDLDPTADSNGYTDHPATNIYTGAVLYGWTPLC
jgi:alpha-L-arabinofuranosidase